MWDDSFSLVTFESMFPHNEQNSFFLSESFQSIWTSFFFSLSVFQRSSRGHNCGPEIFKRPGSSKVTYNSLLPSRSIFRLIQTTLVAATI